MSHRLGMLPNEVVMQVVKKMIANFKKIPQRYDKPRKSPLLVLCNIAFLHPAATSWAWIINVLEMLTGMDTKNFNVLRLIQYAGCVIDALVAVNSREGTITQVDELIRQADTLIGADCHNLYPFLGSKMPSDADRVLYETWEKCVKYGALRTLRKLFDLTNPKTCRLGIPKTQGWYVYPTTVKCLFAHYQWFHGYDKHNDNALFQTFTQVLNDKKIDLSDKKWMLDALPYKVYSSFLPRLDQDGKLSYVALNGKVTNWYKFLDPMKWVLPSKQIDVPWEWLVQLAGIAEYHGTPMNHPLKIVVDEFLTGSMSADQGPRFVMAMLVSATSHRKNVFHTSLSDAMYECFAAMMAKKKHPFDTALEGARYTNNIQDWMAVVQFTNSHETNISAKRRRIENSELPAGTDMQLS